MLLFQPGHARVRRVWRACALDIYERRQSLDQEYALFQIPRNHQIQRKAASLRAGD